ncbi:glycosyltransferase family 4 protein [Pedosphaera parvula]|nr:glycosyltransferase family 4 protein [Pedosphaera parvula]
MISTPFLAVPPKGYGGTELVIFELVEGLVDQGHEVTLFATGDSNTRAALCYLYKKSKWPPHPIVDLNHVTWSFSQINSGKFDAIHTHSPSALAMNRLVPELPMIYTIHHEQEQELSEYYLNFPEVHYVTISQNQKSLETPLPHCDVIHHGLDPSRFECVDVPRDYVCFIGRFSKDKGPHTAIDAAGKAHLTIHVAGEVHPDSAEFAGKLLKPRLNLPHVKCIGCVGTSQKVPLLRDARALLAPLEWEEPFGLVLIEAMLSGCPVVAYPRGSAPELVEAGVTGYLVASVEEMAETIKKGGLLDSFDRRRCRERATERFSRTRLVTNYSALYERVISARARQPCAQRANLSLLSYER